jgi:putative oxidoreductase
MTATEGIVVLLGRVLFAVFFIRSGIAHVRKHEGMTGYARSAGFPFPGIGGWPAGVWLLAGGASIALGIWADVGSLVIALFLVLAALYFHRFWTIQDEAQNSGPVSVNRTASPAATKNPHSASEAPSSATFR